MIKISYSGYRFRTRDLALYSVRAELPRRRRFVGGTRDHGLLSDRPALGEPFRADGRSGPAQTPTQTSYDLLGWMAPTASMCRNEVVADLKQRRSSVESISRIGTDTSKHIFQLHGVNVAEQLVQQRPWRKRYRAGGRRPEAHARKDSSDSPVPVGMGTKAVSIVAIFLGRHPSDDQISKMRLPLWTSTGKAEQCCGGRMLVIETLDAIRHRAICRERSGRTQGGYA